MLAVMNSSRSCEEERPLQLGAEALGHRGDGARVLHVLEEHGELVAAEPGDGVLRPQAMASRWLRPTRS